ncbi:hypothetical protein CDAR_283151 [Caerostris darwini]|uniref:Uncharacterized protein n=1 Tax=Caerostris darwini TaxID=1538125 RepID=A0AAV4MI32_9ARAC|nr:hypothetical protein CDAR_283151 [Caerostris darwini]
MNILGQPHVIDSLADFSDGVNSFGFAHFNLLANRSVFQTIFGYPVCFRFLRPKLECLLEYEVLGLVVTNPKLSTGTSHCICQTT